MRTRVAIRPPEEMVAFLDRAVAEGKASSRAALVSPALEREMRRPVAEQDSALLTEGGAGDDLDALAHWSVGHLDVGEWRARDLPGSARQDPTRRGAHP